MKNEKIITQAEIKCPDGGTVLVSVHSGRIEASAKMLGILPKKIWEFSFPSPSNEEIDSKEILRITLDAVPEAETAGDLAVLLKYNAAKALRAYFEKGGSEKAEASSAAAEQPSESESGAKAMDPREFQQMEAIVVSYAKVLERLGQQTFEKYQAGFYPISHLPHPKEKIRKALQTAITHTIDPKMAENLKECEKFLDHFIDDTQAKKKNAKAKEMELGGGPAGEAPQSN